MFRNRLGGHAPAARRLPFGRLVGCALVLLVGTAAAAFEEPLDSPAPMVSAPEAQPLQAVAVAGTKLVAVGSRGLVITSDRAIGGWVQAHTPVQTDLIALSFLPSGEGWACGHQGVVLHTTDEGLNWTKQLDGWGAKKQFEAFYAAHPLPAGQTDDPARLQISTNFKDGPTLPWLGVWFEDAKNGYVVGSFGDIARTTDGGASWTPWLDHIDNPNFLDLNAMGTVGGQLYIVGEQGTVWERDAQSGRFVSRATGYDGTLFGLTGTAQTLLVFGLRGTIMRSEDGGKSWSASTNPVHTTLLSGTALADGTFVLTALDGQIIVSRDGGRTFVSMTHAVPSALTGIIAHGKDNVVLTGLAGVTPLSIR